MSASAAGPPADDESRLGLVLTGGGPRGAYEAGALSVVLPELARRGLRPTVFTGASVGAINALTLAGMRHLDPEEAVERGIARWREVVLPNVMRPIAAVQGPRLLARLAGQFVAPAHVRLPALLDPTPLARSLERWVDWEALRENVRSGVVHAAAAIATRSSTGRSTAFVACREDLSRRTRTVDYVPVDPAVEHLMAATAMPLLFPPVHVESPAAARGWYFDGTTRLRSPIKTALDLGAERLVIVAATPVDLPDDPPAEDPEPDLATGAAHILGGLLEDTVVDDVHQLDEVNAFVAGGGAVPEGETSPRYVPRVVVAPTEVGEIGRTARDILRSRGLPSGLRDVDLHLLDRIFGGDSPSQGDVLSYLMFDLELIDELIRMGRRDGERMVDEAVATLAPS